MCIIIKNWRENLQMKKFKGVYKRILFIAIACYVISIFVSQQKEINSYNKEIKQYEIQIQEAKETKESLLSMKDNVNSPEYIEQVAREKLGMYLPNERVYIDKAQ